MEIPAISKAKFLLFYENNDIFLKLHLIYDLQTRDTNLDRFAYVTKVYDLDRSEEYVSK